MKRPRQTGFTLIELLVVLAILGILTSILIPLTQQTKKRTSTLTCLTNLRTIAQSMHAYLHDHDNRIPRDYWYGTQLQGPFPTSSAEDKHALWAEEFLPYISGRSWPVIPDNLETWNSRRDKYLAALFYDVDIYRCPQMPPHPSITSQTVTHPDTNNSVVMTHAPLSYAINAMRFRQYNANETSSPRHPITEISQPSSIIYITEANTRQSWTNFGTSDIFQKRHLWNGSGPRMANDQRHGDKIGCVFFDCHAELVTITDIDIDDFVPKNSSIQY